MNKILIKNAVKRNDLCLYYIDEFGNLCMCKFGHHKKKLTDKQFESELRKAKKYFDSSSHRIEKEVRNNGKM